MLLKLLSWSFFGTIFYSLEGKCLIFDRSESGVVVLDDIGFRD